MKTTTFLRTLLAITAVATALTSTSCKKKGNEVKPKAVNITYKISTKEKDLKLTTFSVSDTKGGDSSITKDLKFPMEVKIRRATPSKNSTIKIKAKVDKPTKVNLEILVNNKSVKKSEATITDVAKEAILEHKF